MANLGTILYTALFGKKVGTDQYGNKYYVSSKKAGKNIGKYNVERRWVIYNGKAEASKIPAQWHGWMHYTLNEIPNNEKTHSWEKEHLPNLTGTAFSYAPNGHKKVKGKRDKSTGDYKAWKPE